MEQVFLFLFAQKKVGHKETQKAQKERSEFFVSLVTLFGKTLRNFREEILPQRKQKKQRGQGVVAARPAN